MMTFFEFQVGSTAPSGAISCFRVFCCAETDDFMNRSAPLSLDSLPFDNSKSRPPPLIGPLSMLSQPQQGELCKSRQVVARIGSDQISAHIVIHLPVSRQL